MMERIAECLLTRRQALRTGGASLAAVALAAGAGRRAAAQPATPAAGSPAAGGGSDAARAAALDAFIRGAMQTYGVPGAAVAVVHGDRVVLLRGYGVRKVGATARVDADTIFHLASNTKPFTAAALGVQVDAGKLGWDDPVVDHLPEFALYDPYPTRYATSRDLLAHRSGLPAFTGDLLNDLGYDRAEVLRRIRFVPPRGSFREVDNYSNLGFFAAGEVVARVAGTTWEAAVADTLLKPLGMTRTAPAAAVDQSGNVAASHVVIAGKPQAVPWNELRVLAAAGALTSTASDMVRWMQMLLNQGRAGGRQVLQPATVQEMFRPSMVAAPTIAELPPITDQSGFSFTMGWGTFHFNGYPVIEKGGALAGIRSVVELVPALRLGVAVLANLNLTVLPEAIRAFVLEQYLGPATGDLQAEIKATCAKVQELLKPAAPPPNPGPPSLPLAGYAGTYGSPIYGNFTVIQAGDALRIEAGPAKYPGTLIHVSRDTFDLSWGPSTVGSDVVTFTVGPAGQATRFETEGLGSFTRAAVAPGGQPAPLDVD